jgi:DNA-binding transcriptional LysR family regulator
MDHAEQRDIAAGELIDLELIRRFIVVAEELNFTRAAARLGMAQPPLSAAIGKLERKLGVTLFERTSRRVTLTPAGAVLLDQGRIAVEAAAAAVERARRTGTQPGRLTVAVKPGAGTGLIKQIMQRCARDPRVPDVHVLFGHPGGPAAAVRGGAADVAIVRAPFDRRGLDTELLLTEPRVAVLPAHHRLAGWPELRRADLAGEPMPRWAGQSDPVAAAYWSGTDTPAPARSQDDHPPGPEINDISQLLDAVALGNAVAYVPVSAAGQYRSAGLAVVPVIDLSPSELLAAWPESSRSRAVAGFVRAAVEVAASQVMPGPVRGGIIDLSRSSTPGLATPRQSGVSRPHASGSPQFDRCRRATGMVPLGCVGLSAHQHQSTSFSVIQASKLPHHTAEAAWPPWADGVRPKLASDLVSLPNSPIHSGAICSLSRYPPLRRICSRYACRGWPAGWNHE